MNYESDEAQTKHIDEDMHFSATLDQWWAWARDYFYSIGEDETISFLTCLNELIAEQEDGSREHIMCGFAILGFLYGFGCLEMEK